MDQPLLLQQRHVVATVAAETPQLVTFEERLGADGLAGGDIVLDDRAEDVELAVPPSP